MFRPISVIDVNASQCPRHVHRGTSESCSGLLKGNARTVLVTELQLAENQISEVKTPVENEVPVGNP